MKALTLWQPWASLVAMSAKCVEGIMRSEFMKAEKERLELVAKESAKAGLTPFQYQQRWNP